MKVFGYVIGFLIVLALVIFFGGAIVYWTWPVAMKIFGVPALTYFESCGLFSLAGTLVKSYHYHK